MVEIDFKRFHIGLVQHIDRQANTVHILFGNTKGNTFPVKLALSFLSMFDLKEHDLFKIKVTSLEEGLFSLNVSKLKDRPITESLAKTIQEEENKP